MHPDDKPSGPLATVVLLCYNYETYIKEALRGLFAQTYAPLEIIIVDDCSTDRSAELIQGYLDQLGNPGNVRFVRNARNMVHPIPQVMPLVTGELVFILSGDDTMLPDMVSALVDAWQSDQTFLVTGNALYMDENSKYTNRAFRALEIAADDSLESLITNGSNACCFGAAMAFDIRLYKTFGWPPTDFLGCSDIVLPFYAYVLGRACFVNQPVIKYRVHSNNTSLSLQSEKESGEQRLLIEERSLQTHLRHAVFFEQELDRLSALDDGAYRERCSFFRPFIQAQVAEFGRKLVRNWRERHDLAKLPPG